MLSENPNKTVVNAIRDFHPNSIQLYQRFYFILYLMLSETSSQTVLNYAIRELQTVLNICIRALILNIIIFGMIYLITLNTT